MGDPETLRLLAATADNGQAVHEEVRVEPLGESHYRLLQSPGLVLGLAADDVFTLDGDRFAIVSRGGNVCIQIFAEDVEPIEEIATRIVDALGGRHDGQSPKELVYTISIDVGFPTIERALASITASFPDAEWIFGNVYDPDDGVTPLDWWK